MSEHVYRLRVAEADAVPGADEGELFGGNLRPGNEENYMGEDAHFNSRCCYLGYVDGDGETIWLPYCVWE